MKLAINGFGRIGRAAAKIILDQENCELVAINDLGELSGLAHLLKYDSCYGIYNKEVGFDEKELIVNTRKIRFYSEKDPAKLPWRELEVDVVIESTGIFLTKELAKAHIEAGAKKVVMSAPAKDDTPTFVLGVNADKYEDEKIVSCASCTTNCITPVMKLLEDNFGIEKSLMTTIHSYTADQNLVDGPHKDLRRARAAAINIIPTTTGAAKAAFKTIPTLEGRFDGLAIRVPTPVVSLSDITVLLKENTTIEEINRIFSEAAEFTHKGILTVTDEPVVSTDLIQNGASAIVDLSLTQVVKGNLVKVIAWYDNEWGYSNRLVELAQLIVS
jgi:glyceraldehyde 3-phosphate dehydrogenase